MRGFAARDSEPRTESTVVEAQRRKLDAPHLGPSVNPGR